MDQTYLVMTMKTIAAYGESSESAFRQTLGKLYKLLKPVAEDEENMETKARLALLSSALDLSKDIINTEQKGWFGKFIKTKKDNKKTLGVRISEMEKDIHKAINLLSFISLMKTQAPPEGEVNRTILWVDDNPQNNSKEMGISMIQKEGTEQAFQYLEKNKCLHNASSTEFRIITDAYRDEDDGEKAGEHFIKRLRESGWTTPVLIHCADLQKQLRIQATYPGISVSTTQTWFTMFLTSMLECKMSPRIRDQDSETKAREQFEREACARAEEEAIERQEKGKDRKRQEKEKAEKNERKLQEEERGQLELKAKEGERKKDAKQKDHPSSKFLPNDLAEEAEEESLSNLFAKAQKESLTSTPSIYSSSFTLLPISLNKTINLDDLPTIGAPEDNFEYEETMSLSCFDGNCTQILPAFDASEPEALATSEVEEPFVLTDTTLPSVAFNLYETPAKLPPKNIMGLEDTLPFPQLSLMYEASPHKAKTEPPILEVRGPISVDVGRVNSFTIKTALPHLEVRFEGCSISFEGYLSQLSDNIVKIDYFPTRAGDYKIRILSAGEIIRELLVYHEKYDDREEEQTGESTEVDLEMMQSMESNSSNSNFFLANSDDVDENSYNSNDESGDNASEQSYTSHSEQEVDDTLSADESWMTLK